VKKSSAAGIVILTVIALLAVTGISSVNALVAGRENVKAALGNIDTQYQRRADLIPNLVAIADGAVTAERQTLTDVVNARAAATNAALGQNPTQSDIQNYADAQGDLSSALSRLLIVVEAYPQLASTQTFIDLQAQLEGTENRIAVVRGDYNDVARSYNTSISTFPTLLFAGMLGHTVFPYFDASPGADKAPQVTFNN
jgi:LemA protein